MTICKCCGQEIRAEASGSVNSRSAGQPFADRSFDGHSRIDTPYAAAGTADRPVEMRHGHWLFDDEPMPDVRMPDEAMPDVQRLANIARDMPAHLPAIAPEPVIEVDADLLESINLAHADADADGSAHVEIAHLARRLLWAQRDTPQFVNADALIERASWWIAYMALRRGKAPLRTADDLKALLARAEQRAKHSGRRYAAPADALDVLFDDSGDLATAEFFATVPAGNLADAAEYRRIGPALAERKTAERETLASGHVSAANGDATRLPTGLDAHHALDQSLGHSAALPEIEYRLEQHDRALALIRDQLGHLIEATDAAARATAAREHRAEQQIAAQMAIAQQMAEANRSRNAQRSAENANRDRNGGDTGGTGNHSAASSSRARNAGGNRKSLWQRSKRRSWASLRRNRRRKSFAEPRSGQPQASSGRPELSVIHNAFDTGRAFDAGRNAFDLRPARVSNENASQSPADRETGTSAREKRFYLAPGDDIVDAPSIGHKTAAILNDAGLYTVRDLLDADAADVAAKVDLRYISAERVAAWQQQARLVCTIPWLRGTHAQLLVGAGYPTVTEILAASADDVTAAILDFAGTRDGQSVLRNNPAPATDRIREWVANAALAEPARAA